MQVKKLSLALTLTLSLFTDPAIAAKYFGLSPAPYLILIVGGVLYQTFFLASCRNFRINKRILSLAAIFTAYAIVSLAYRAWCRQSIGDLSLHILMLCNFYCILLVITDTQKRDSITLAMIGAGAIHLITLIPDPFGFRENLIAATAYDLGGGGLAALSRRETGLFPAPAMLVAFSLCLFVVGILWFIARKNWLWPTVSVAISVVLGLSTHSRSFPVALIFAMLVCAWCSGYRLQIIVFYAIGSLALLLLPLGQYIEYVGSRLYLIIDNGIEASQRWTGATGVLTGLDSFLGSPFLGTPAAPDGGILQALGTNSEPINPHNALVQLLAIYGLIAGGPVLLLYLGSLWAAIRIVMQRDRLLNKLRGATKSIPITMLYAAISLALLPILLIEPLGEYSFIFLLFISPLIIKLPWFNKVT